MNEQSNIFNCPFCKKDYNLLNKLTHQAFCRKQKLKRDLSGLKLKNNIDLDNTIQKIRNNTNKSEERQNNLKRNISKNKISNLDKNNIKLPPLTPNNTRTRFNKDNNLGSNIDTLPNIFFNNNNNNKSKKSPLKNYNKSNNNSPLINNRNSNNNSPLRNNIDFKVNLLKEINRKEREKELWKKQKERIQKMKEERQKKEEEKRKEEEKKKKEEKIKQEKKRKEQEKKRKMIEEWKRKKEEEERRRREQEERRKILERERRRKEQEERRRRLQNLRIIHNEDDSDSDDDNENESNNNKTIIKKLPESVLEDINKLNEENKKCVICFDDFKNNDIVTYLPCFHLFHKDCIVKWTKNMPVCPICKINIKNNLD